MIRIVRPDFKTLATVVALLGAQFTWANELLSSRIDELVRSYQEDWQAPGISVGVALNGQVVHARGYGLAEVENQIPATEHTVYRIGSITKQFTAAAILLLVEDGKLSLDDELGTLLPDYPTHGADITVAQLLNHTSGIKGYTEMATFWEKGRLDLGHAEMLSLFGAEPLEFQPGDRWQYNNSAYYLLGVIVEKLSGQSYAEFLQTHIFDPLRLVESWYLDNATIVPNRAQGYDFVDGKLVNDAPLSMRLPYSAGSMGSTVADLLAWQRALRNGEILSEKSYRQMVTPLSLNDGEPLTYGYGVAVGALEGRRKISHGGGINGFRTQLAWYPEEDLAVVVLVNAGSGRPGPLESAITRVILGIPEKSIDEIQLSDAQLNRYAGTFDGGRAEFTIGTENGALVMLGRRLRAAGDHVFHPVGDNYSTVTFDVVDGEITSLRTEREGQITVAPRVTPTE